MVTSQLVARNVYGLIDFIWQRCVQKLQNYTEFFNKKRIFELKPVLSKLCHTHRKTKFLPAYLLASIAV